MPVPPEYLVHLVGGLYCGELFTMEWDDGCSPHAYIQMGDEMYVISHELWSHTYLYAHDSLDLTALHGDEG